MSPTQRRTGKPGDVGLSTERAPFVTSSNGTTRTPVELDVEDDGPVEIPDIVPATIDPDPNAPAPIKPEPTDRAPADPDRIDRAPLDPDRSDPDQIVTGEPVPSAAPLGPDPTDGWTAGTFAALNSHLRTGQSGLRPPTRRPRVRKVTRVLRHIDPWSTFKLALVFSVILYGILLTAGVLIWNVALNTGTVDNIERWFTQFGWDSFELQGGEIFHNAWISGLFGVVALTGFAVLAVTLFNLVSDMIGGIRMTVLEEEVVERTVVPGRKFVVRRPPVDDEAAGSFDLDGDLPATGDADLPSTVEVEPPTVAAPVAGPAVPVEESPG